MNSKYLFIHFTLLFLFLTFTLSSAHGNSHPDTAPLTDNNKCQCPCPCPPPEQNNNIHVPPQGQAPGDNNKPPQPPNTNNQSPQTPGDSNKPPQPPIGSNQPPQPPNSNDQPPQPPNDSNNPPQPPSGSDQPPQLPSDSNKPPQPPSGSDKPPRLPSDDNNPPQPSSDSNKPPQVPSGSDQPPQAPSGSDQPPQLSNNGNKPSQPPSGSDQLPQLPSEGNQPPSSSDKPPQPPSGGDQSPQPPSDVVKPPQPPSDGGKPPPPPPAPENNNQSPPLPQNDQPPQPPSGSNQPPQPPSGSDQPPQPPSGSDKPPQPPSDGAKAPQPPSDSDKPPPSPPAPENNNQSPTLPQNDSNNPNPTTPGNEGYEGCFSKIFAFGDSYTDTGNAYAMGGLQSFVGSIKSKFPGHRNLKGHRQCDGRLVVDFLCEKLAMPQLPPYKQASSNFSWGANFAVAGSTAFSKDFFSKHLGHNLMWKGTPLGFQVQIEWFQKFKSEAVCKGKDDSACKVEMENSLFWVGEIGGSDYARTFGSALSHKLQTDLTLGQVSKIVTSLLDNGAKYIVVQGLPPLGCCPLEMFLSKASDRDQMGCSSTCNSLIQAHNEHLQTMILEWQKKYPGCVIAYADYWSAYKAILANPKKYNFEEPSKACCGAGGPLNFNMRTLCGSIGTSACKDPSRYMHWDGIHLTEAMHKHITDLFLNQGYCKPSFAELVKKKRGM